MRMPCVRFTVRRMMVAVTFFALALGAEAARRRWAYRLARAEAHGGMERMLAGDAEVALALVGQAAGGSVAAREAEADRWRTEAVRYSTRAAYHHGMKARYERAARYPWLPVAPDPPEPE